MRETSNPEEAYVSMDNEVEEIQLIRAPTTSPLTFDEVKKLNFLIEAIDIFETCWNCGEKIKGNERICFECGLELEQERVI